MGTMTEEDFKDKIHTYQLELEWKKGNEFQYIGNPDYLVSKVLGADVQFWADVTVEGRITEENNYVIEDISLDITLFEGEDGEVEKDLDSEMKEDIERRIKEHFEEDYIK